MKTYLPSILILFLLLFFQCKENNTNIAQTSSKGIGSISSVIVGPIDPTMVKEGEALYNTKCIVCHKMNENMVGPALAGVTKIRTPEWIMNMILNPEEMTKKDETAQSLLKKYVTQMTFQNLTEKEVRSMLEFFRDYDTKASESK